MLQAFEPHLATLKKAQRLQVALSGGIDSLSMLMALCRIAKEESLPSINAIHVNHQLHPDADAWADRCAEFCRHLDVDLTIRVISVVDSGKGPEAAARQARYEVLESLLIPGDLLLMGHHQDDQAEGQALVAYRQSPSLGSAVKESCCDPYFKHHARSSRRLLRASHCYPSQTVAIAIRATTGTSLGMRCCPSWSNAGHITVTALCE